MVGNVETRQAPPVLRMTYDEYHAWLDEDRHAEWVDGEVIVQMPATFQHALGVAFLTTLLGLFASQTRSGIVLTAPFEMLILDGRVAREPDILFVATANAGRIA